MVQGSRRLVPVRSMHLNHPGQKRFVLNELAALRGVQQPFIQFALQ